MIYVLEQGSVIECGDWDELRAKENGHFQALCRAQEMDRSGILKQRSEQVSSAHAENLTTDAYTVPLRRRM